MKGGARLAAFAFVAFAAAASAPEARTAEPPKPSPAPALAKPASAPAAAPALKLEGLTKEAFQKLPDDALLDVGGKRIRKTDFIAEFKRGAEARNVANLKVSKNGLDANRARLSAEEDKGIADSSAQVRKQMDQGGNK